MLVSSPKLGSLKTTQTWLWTHLGPTNPEKGQPPNRSSVTKPSCRYRNLKFRRLQRRWHVPWLQLRNLPKWGRFQFWAPVALIITSVRKKSGTKDLDLDDTLGPPMTLETTLPDDVVIWEDKIWPPAWGKSVTKSEFGELDIAILVQKRFLSSLNVRTVPAPSSPNTWGLYNHIWSHMALQPHGALGCGFQMCEFWAWIEFETTHMVGWSSV